MNRVLREILLTLILALGIFLLVRTTVQNFVVEGYSMEPGLNDGQVVLVNKVSSYLHPPRRGDIIVFRSVGQADRDLVKRVIALPGETIEIRNGKTFINGEPREEPYARPKEGDFLRPTVVPPDSFFVMGDNRAHSTDSRQWGPLPRENIVGRAWLSLWPIGDWGLAPNYSWASP